MLSEHSNGIAKWVVFWDTAYDRSNSYSKIQSTEVEFPIF